MKRRIALPLLVAPLALMACGNEYHPEYHPVTVTSYQQRVAYPAAPAGGAQPPPVVFSAPPPPAPPAPEPWSAWPSE